MVKRRNNGWTPPSSSRSIVTMLVTPSKTPEDLSPATSTTTTKITRGHSCVLCQQRKVKCDRQKPCSNCIKSRVECVASTPAIPRRRRRKPVPEGDLVAKLRRYEQLLQSHGVKIDEDDDSIADSTQSMSNHHLDPDIDADDMRRLTMTVPRLPNAERGAMFFEKTGPRYVENTLWEGLRDEIQEPQESSEDDTTESGILPEPESFLMELGSVQQDLSSLHPPVVQIFRMWQIFLENVNPMTKVFHAPTVQQVILDASGNIQKITRPNEALMFVIYFLAITSITNEECEKVFNESRQRLLSKYAHAAQKALINAKFMKSLSLTTFQAFVLYVIGSRPLYDPHSVWVLTGVTVRIAQRLGIHREPKSPRITPFEAEMRRRTWWQVVFLDGHASKLAGGSSPAWANKFDANLPRNLSDSDLYPSMKELPPNKEGATEMIFCCLRYDVVQTLREAGTFQTFSDGTLGPDLLAAKDMAVDLLEQKFQEKYVRYCDPSIPLHLLATYVAKSIICTMRIMSHHPRQYADRGLSVPQSQKDQLFRDSLTEIEIGSSARDRKVLQGYFWFTNMHFQLDAFIYVLSELRTRLSGDLVEKAWQEVERVFNDRPGLLNDTKNVLYFAVGTLTLKAWAKREEMNSFQQTPPPRYISILRSQRNTHDATQLPQYPNLSTNFETPNNYRSDISKPNQNATDMWADVGSQELPAPDIHMSEVTQTDWEYWQTLMDGYLPPYVAETGRENWY